MRSPEGAPPRGASNEKGTALIETALIASLLIVLGLGAAEFGFALIDWLTVANASREGARTGSAAGQATISDDLVLDAVYEALAGSPNILLQEVWIYRTDSTGVPDATAINKYGGGGYVCSPCDWPTGLGRDVTLAGRDYLGVRIVWQHDWLTGFVPWIGNQIWRDDAVMRLELPPPDPTT